MTLRITVICFLLVFQTVIAQNGKDIVDRHKITKEERLIYNMEFEFSRSCDPATNEMPQGIRQNEINFTSKIPSIEQSISLKKLSGNTILSTPDWRQRGPWNTGGRFLCIAFDEDNDKIINAGAASGGMWRSIDKGLSWVKTSDLLSVQSIYCLVQNKQKYKKNIWFYGTGEMLSTTDRSVSVRARTMMTGGGIWKSTDNGASWFPLKSTLGGNQAYPDNPFQGVWNIVIDNRAQGDVVYASCYGGVYRSTDGGDNWQMVLGDATNKPFSTFIVQNSFGILFAAISPVTLTGTKPNKYGVFRSSDNGETWTKITPQGFSDTIRTIKLATSESNPNVVYMLAEKIPFGTDPYYFNSSYQHHFFWKYTDNPSDGNGKWINRSAYIPNPSQKISPFSSLGSYCLTLLVKPDDENVVILGGTNVYVTTDGLSGNYNIKHIGGYYPTGGYDLENLYCHPDIHGFAIPPSNSNALFVANDGGIHMTHDYTTAKPQWVSLNNGLLGSQFYTVSIDHSQAEDPLIFGGLQDNSSQLTFSGDKTEPWPAVIGGDGMATAVAAVKKFFLGSWYNGSVMSFNYSMDSKDTNYIYQTPDSIAIKGFEFYTLFNLDRNDNKTFYIPARSLLYRKDDIAASANDTSLVNKGWTRIAQEPTGNSITAIGLSEKPADILYYGTNKGRIYKITNTRITNPASKDITSSSMPKNAYCSGIDVDPENADDLIVVFSNYNVESIFHSSDGGTTFEPVSGNLEEVPEGQGSGPGVRRVMKVYIGETPVWFAATTSGLFSTAKLEGPQTVWVREGSETIGNVIVDWIDARQHEGYVVIGTQGAGVFSVKYPTVGVEQVPAYNFSLADSRPNPARENVEISFTLDKEQRASLRLYDFKGREISVLAEGLYPAGKNIIKYNCTKLPTGVYFYTLSDGIQRITKRLIIER